MAPEGWLKSSLMLPGLGAKSVQEIVQAVAVVFGQAAGENPARIRAALGEAMRGESFSIGRGVAVPHTEMESLTQTLVCLVTVSQPLPLSTVDGHPPDVFFFILSKPDPHAHLLLLAHLARLAQSRTLLEGLRRARSQDEMFALVQAAEMRHSTASATAVASAPHALVIVSVRGEKLVDALLIDLVAQGFGDASILEAQSLHEAVAREVPLFAGLRDLFGDPGGRRLLIMEAASDRADLAIETVKRLSEEYRARDARVSIIPMLTGWTMPPVADEKASGGD